MTTQTKTIKKTKLKEYYFTLNTTIGYAIKAKNKKEAKKIILNDPTNCEEESRMIIIYDKDGNEIYHSGLLQ